MRSNVKKQRFFPALLAMAAVLTVTASAVEFGYSGLLDTETGDPIESSSDEDGIDAYSSRVRVSDGVYYDRNRMGYVYESSGGQQVMCTVASGMVVQEAVRVVPDEGVSVILYKDGTAVEEPDLTHISEVGDYVVEVVAVGDQASQVISFSIVGDVTSRMEGYSMPDGFIITGATLDEQDTAWDRSYISMTEEGEYDITYRCSRNGLDYELKVGVDHTPPVLALEGVENGRARQPVSLADLEDGASITIQLNGKQISYREELTESGDYRIWVMDAAGNLTTYEFSILVYFDFNSLVFMGMLAAVLAAVGIYIVLSRKRLEVR